MLKVTHRCNDGLDFHVYHLETVIFTQGQWGFPNLDQKCILALLRSLLILGLIDLDLQFHF